MNLKKNILLFSSIVTLDRLTKYLVLNADNVPQAITSYFDITRSFNRGISWGMLHFSDTTAFWLLNLFIGLFIAGFAWHTFKQQQQGHKIVSNIAVLAGACSNFYDRILYGGVLDFITLHWGTYYWPSFNVADVAIVAGVVWMLTLIVKE